MGRSSTSSKSLQPWARSEPATVSVCSWCPVWNTAEAARDRIDSAILQTGKAILTLTWQLHCSVGWSRESHQNASSLPSGATMRILTARCFARVHCAPGRWWRTIAGRAAPTSHRALTAARSRSLGTNPASLAKLPGRKVTCRRTFTVERPLHQPESLENDRMPPFIDSGDIRESSRSNDCNLEVFLAGASGDVQFGRFNSRSIAWKRGSLRRGSLNTDIF